MTTTDPLEHSGDTVTAAVAEDGKLYYEGTMDTATALPWLVKLTYTLDGPRSPRKSWAAKAAR